MSTKPVPVLWHGFHPSTTNIGLRVVERQPGALYGEEVDLTITDPNADPVLASLPINHVAAIAIRDLAEKVKKIEETKE